MTNHLTYGMAISFTWQVAKATISMVEANIFLEKSVPHVNLTRRNMVKNKEMKEKRNYLRRRKYDARDHETAFYGMKGNRGDKRRTPLGMCLKETNKKVIEVVMLMARGVPQLISLLVGHSSNRAHTPSTKPVEIFHSNLYSSQDHSDPRHLPRKLN